MLRFERTNSQSPEFINLVLQLDIELGERDGAEHSFYQQYNKIDAIRYALVAFDEDEPVGCGALKVFNDETMEIKRMFVPEEYRGKGVASQILRELESWSLDLGYSTCILETGKRQPEAIQLYKKSGYEVIPNYGQYAGVENSMCFEKSLADMDKKDE
ncbi:MAG: GNAT family N-acetyltransferase [Calditrichia bacterium]